MSPFFGKIGHEDIQEIHLFTKYGAYISVVTWGATLRDLQISNGVQKQRIVLGYQNIEAYRINPN